MSFPKYPEYKDSGVEWLGEVPAKWHVARAFHLGFDIKTGKVDVNIQEEEGVYPFFTCSRDAKKANQFSFDCEALLVAGNGEVGYTQYYNGKFEAYQRTYVISNFGGASARFLRYHFMENLVASVKGKSIGSVIQFITLGDLRDFPVPVPSKEEQTQIAHFLDNETARIDALIEEQQRLIELLKEKRQAVISQAVTKGLAPTVPMKDSGVEWLGEVPAHWNVGTLRWYATIQGGVAKGKDYEGRETVVMPYLRVANVQNGYVDLAEVKEIAVLESEVERYRLRAGDVLMNEGGDNDKLGRGTVWQAQIDPCLHQNHVFAIRPNGLLRAEWLAAFTQAEQARTYFYLNSKQSTNLASISASNVMSLALPIPSEKEQLEILTYLEADRIRHEELTAVAVSTVELLQERRSALISAAVTGKIDVRGWQPPVSTQAPEFEVAEAV